MNSFSPLMIRTAVAKTLGLIIGIIAFYSVRMIAPAADPLLAWGFLVLFLTIGGLVGISGIVVRIPIVNISYSPILRGGFMGAWLGFMAALFGYYMIQNAMIEMDFMGLTSPWLIMVDTFIAGALIDVFVTRWVKNVPSLY